MCRPVIESAHIFTPWACKSTGGTVPRGAFVGPDATLYADQGFNGEVGTHYAGPTWEAEDGSKVVAARVADCTPNRGAIPWLRLDAVSSSPEGKFGRVTHVLRVNTIGGTAPAAVGAFVGD